MTGDWAVVSTLAGGNGAYADGSGTNAGFSSPTGLTVDASANVFVADNGNQRIRKLTAGAGMFPCFCLPVLLVSTSIPLWFGVPL